MRAAAGRDAPFPLGRGGACGAQIPLKGFINRVTVSSPAAPREHSHPRARVGAGLGGGGRQRQPVLPSRGRRPVAVGELRPLPRGYGALGAQAALPN